MRIENKLGKLIIKRKKGNKLGVEEGGGQRDSPDSPGRALHTGMRSMAGLASDLWDCSPEN